MVLKTEIDHNRGPRGAEAAAIHPKRRPQHALPITVGHSGASKTPASKDFQLRPDLRLEMARVFDGYRVYPSMPGTGVVYPGLGMVRVHPSGKKSPYTQNGHEHDMAF